MVFAYPMVWGVCGVRVVCEVNGFVGGITQPFIQYGMVWYGHAMLCYDMVWYGLTWGVIWAHF